MIIHGYGLTNLIFYVSIAVLLLITAWFFVLYGIANQNPDKRIDISVPASKVQNITTDYNYEIKSPSVHVVQEKNGVIRATIDVGGIITAAIGASVSMVVSKILNRYWPDKRKKH